MEQLAVNTFNSFYLKFLSTKKYCGLGFTRKKTVAQNALEVSAGRQKRNRYEMKRVIFIICLLYFSTETSAWRRRRRRRAPPPCNAANCQVGSWTSWTSCSHQCGSSGTQTRTRQVVQGASCGGTCPYNLVETQACNRDSCQNGGTPRSSGCSCRAGYGGTCCEQGES